MLETIGQTSGSLLKHWLLADLAEARHVLEAGNVDLNRAVHLTRRRLKRVRTLFFVLKPLAGAGHEDRTRAVRHAFGLLSGSRDADAMLKAARWLLEKADSKTEQAALAVVDLLSTDVAVRHGQQTPIAEICRLLRIAESEAAALAAEPDSSELLRDGLIRTYARGRKLYRAALDAPDDDEALHDWRKQVKHRMHIGQIIDGAKLPIGPLVLDDLDRLAEYLGEGHDFANLGVWICDDGALGRRPRDLARISADIVRRRLKLADRALELGSELYRNRASSFATGLKAEG